MKHRSYSQCIFLLVKKIEFADTISHSPKRKYKYFLWLLFSKYGAKKFERNYINTNKYSKHFLINLFTLIFISRNIFPCCQLIYLSIQLSHVFSNLIKQNQ